MRVRTAVSTSIVVILLLFLAFLAAYRTRHPPADREVWEHDPDSECGGHNLDGACEP